MIQPGLVDERKVRAVDLPEIDAPNFGAQRLPAGNDLEFGGFGNDRTHVAVSLYQNGG
jgi:hypothetical protein